MEKKNHDFYIVLQNYRTSTVLWKLIQMSLLFFILVFNLRILARYNGGPFIKKKNIFIRLINANYFTCHVLMWAVIRVVKLVEPCGVWLMSLCLLGPPTGVCPVRSAAPRLRVWGVSGRIITLSVPLAPAWHHAHCASRTTMRRRSSCSAASVTGELRSSTLGLGCACTCWCAWIPFNSANRFLRHHWYP